MQDPRAPGVLADCMCSTRDRETSGSLGYLDGVPSVGKPVQTNEAHRQLTLLAR